MFDPAFARSRKRMPAMVAEVHPGLYAGKLEVTFTVPVTSPGTLSVELSNAQGTHALAFAFDAGEVLMVDLEPYTRELAPGSYDVAVRWQSPELDVRTSTTTYIPYHCGLSLRAHESSPAPSPPTPSALPYALAAIASLLVALRLAKRAGTDGTHVP